MSFLRPSGAAADAAEIEYVSALHQTGDDLRRDGSIRAEDIARYLVSRHGIKVDPDYAERRIIRNGLGAWSPPVPVPAAAGVDDGSGNGEDDGNGGKETHYREQFLDLAELVSLLLIPELIKASMTEIHGQAVLFGDKTEADFESKLEYDDYLRRCRIAESLKPPPDIIGNVLDRILEEATGTTEPQVLDADLLRRILLAHGETKLAENDDLIDSMIASAGSVTAATTGGGDADNDTSPAPILFDRQTFAHALVGDVQQTYRVEDDVDLTTIFYDVFKKERSGGITGVAPEKLLLAPLEKAKHVPVPFPRTKSTSRAEEEAEDITDHGTKSGTEVVLDDAPLEDAPELSVKEEKKKDDVDAKSGSNVDAQSSSPLQPDAPKFVDDSEAKTIFTLPTIDYMADTFRSKAVAVALWTFLLTQVLAAGAFGLQDFPQLVPTTLENCDSGIGCATAEVILSWYVHFVFLHYSLHIPSSSCRIILTK